MSDSAVASAFQPTSPGVWVASEKCTPSTIVSIEVTASGRARTTAASSPVQRTVRSPRSLSAAWIARIRSSSATSALVAPLLARPGLALGRALGGWGLLPGLLDIGRVLGRLLVVARVELLTGAGSAAAGVVGGPAVVLAVGRRDRFPGGRVLPEEGVEHGGLLGHREVIAVLAVRLDHERVPDRGGVGAALRTGHRDAGVRIAHPDRGREVWRVAHEPGVLGLVRGAGLPGRGTPVVGR